MSDKFVSGTDRQQQITQIVSQRGRLSVSELCDLFDISEATARRDLEVLASERKIQRVHGGAISAQQAPPELPILERSNEQGTEKKRIGKAAAELVEDGETIFLGSGTTVLEAARELRTHRNLTVITNSLPILNSLANVPEITIVSLGGMLRASELSFIGHITEEALSELRVDKVFMGVRAVSLEHGLTNDYLSETKTDRAILSAGREVIILADHTKFGRVAAAFLASTDDIHVLITDNKAPSEAVRDLRKRKVRVIIAK